MIEDAILAGLLNDEEYLRRVFPFLKVEYFESPVDKTIFESICEFVEKYNKVPNRDAIQIIVDSKENLNESFYESISAKISNLELEDDMVIDFLVDKTEKFCKDRALFNAVKESILVIDDKHKTISRSGMPKLFEDALSVSFDTNIGHDFVDNADDRYAFYQSREEKVPFGLDILDRVTKGGLSKKSISIILGGTGAGKTLCLTHFASSYLMQGLNVLYISLEMSEERIAERIDANIMDITLDRLRDLPKDTFDKKISKIKENTLGKMVIKEYPTASAGSAHFRHLMNELAMKKNFKPDVLIIDYINICVSSRLKYSNSVNSYTMVKSIVEELRGLSIEFNLPVLTATQTNRTGMSSQDLELEDISESFGSAMTADFILGISTSPELEKMKQLQMKQLKNRWGALDYYRKFVVGVDRSKMKLFDIDATTETTSEGVPDDYDSYSERSGMKGKFEGFE